MRFEIDGREISVEFLPSRNRNAWARLRDDTLTITIPSRWPESEKRRIGGELLKKAIDSIQKGKWTGELAKKVSFKHGQRVEAFGRKIDIEFIPGKRFKAGFTDSGSRLVVVMDENHPRKIEKASRIVKERLIEKLCPELEKRVKHLNEIHFKAPIKQITVRDNLSRWGSCARDGSISLNLRLLFMPETILDYVIVHELAHTKYRSHGPRFWALVESVMSDHKERRKWLRENGWDYPKDSAASQDELRKEVAVAKKEGQLTIADFTYEEQY